MSANPDAELELALRLADAADEVALGHFRRVRELTVETKPDLTPVTVADRTVEAVLRDRIAEARPEDGIVGEEHGETGDPSRRWVLDPIDGTMNFIRGVPIWSTLISLELDGRPEVAVVSAPALCARWWAARGHGAHQDGEPLAVSAVADLGDAHLAYDSLPEMSGYGYGEAFLELVPQCWRTRGLGDFWGHALVAQGAMDVTLEPCVARWDWSAPSLLVEEAGGRATTLEGTPLEHAGSILTTNGHLHDRVLEIFARRVAGNGGE